MGEKEAPIEVVDIHTLKDFPIARHPCSTTESSEDRIFTAGRRTWTPHLPQKSEFGEEESEMAVSARDYFP